MKISTHLILISKQPIPNLTPMLDECLKPDKVVMLVSEDMQEQADALAAIFKPRGIQVQQYQVADPWHVEGVSNTVLDIVSQYEEGTIALNATGGTKLMSIAAYEVFRSVNAPIYYIHPEQDKLLWLVPKRPDYELAERLELKDYLMAYGASQVKISDPQGLKAEVKGLIDKLLADMERYTDKLGALNYLAYTANNPQFAVDLNQHWQDTELMALVDVFAQAGLCRVNGKKLVFSISNEEARFMANGGWLEWHTYSVCLQLKKAMSFQDVGRNVLIHRLPASKTEVKNEIDVAFIKNNRLHLLECKTKQLGKDQDKDADMLYKLDSLRDLMGGLQGREMLVSFNKLDKMSRTRAKELGITVCCGKDLRNLQAHIQTWVGK